jgi:hypothetical protein
VDRHRLSPVPSSSPNLLQADGFISSRHRATSTSRNSCDESADHCNFHSQNPNPGSSGRKFVYQSAACTSPATPRKAQQRHWSPLRTSCFSPPETSTLRVRSNKSSASSAAARKAVPSETNLWAHCRTSPVHFCHV